MSQVIGKLSVQAGLHQFPQGVFGSTNDLVHPAIVRERDTLMIACSEQGTAPDNVSFAKPGRFCILQHIGPSMPSRLECEQNEGLSCEEVENLFDRHDFHHVIVCGHLDCGVIRSWLEPITEGDADIGGFRRRFEMGTRDLVDRHYSPETIAERCTLMICEHVLCQIENLISHPFILERVLAEKTSFHGWVIDDQTARVFSYSPEEVAFVPI